MLIATFILGQTQETAKVIKQIAYRGLNDPEKIKEIEVDGVHYRVVRYIPDPAPAYLFLVEKVA